MAPRGKRSKFKQWLLSFFLEKGEIGYMPDGPQCHAAPGGFFGYAQNFTLNNPTMTAVQGNQYTYVQGDRNIVPQIMSLLAQHIIQGAAHDSSARTPPPRCHPHTRVRLIARITAWFDGEDLRELLLWITGPAGVGKSAVVQTFAEYLAKSKSLGASVFISRPNKRNNPHGIFITIAYQLATRIEAYRNFIVERLSLDPELLRGGMQAQFTTFIVEPFVEKGIGAGGKRWGILLDGLDELQGEDAQCNIIQLISTFVREHPDVPLLWIIASRPESRLSNTFDDDEVRHSCLTEYIPIDSTEACEDVERFLRSSFQTIQKDFRDSVPSDWPSDTDFLQLTAAASGLFVYAEVVMRFIRDSDHADPVTQFEVLLSVINRSTAVATKDNPFVHLDALYHEILSSIPSRLWPTAKRLLGFTIHRADCTSYIPFFQRHFHTLRGMSIFFNLNRHTIYACLTKCRSTLKIPDWKAAHKRGLTFLHASFSDYLQNPSRSGDFYVGNWAEIEEDVFSSVFEIWNMCSGGDIATTSVESAWHQYCSKLDDGRPSRAVSTFHVTLFHCLVGWLGSAVCRTLAMPSKSLAGVQLSKVHMAKLFHYFSLMDFTNLVDRLVNDSPIPFSRRVLRQPEHTRLCWRIELKDLKFGHLDWKEMSPVSTYRGRTGVFSKEDYLTLNRPRSSAELKAFVSELERLQEHSPQLEVFILGGIPEGRVAAFYRPAGKKSKEIYYWMPYPE